MKDSIKFKKIINAKSKLTITNHQMHNANFFVVAASSSSSSLTKGVL